jgi:glycosyltransferase involved in cell wall biosynthesis
MDKNHLHVITNFEQIGGAEQMLIRLVNESKEQSCIIVSLINVSDLMSKQLPEHVQVIALNCKSPIDLLFSAIKLKNLIKNHQPHCVYSWMYHANFSAALAKWLLRKKTRLVWGVRHSLDDLNGERFSTKLAIYAGCFLANIPDKVIYCSARAMHQHIKFGYSKANKSVYIPNGYKFSSFNVKAFNKKNLVIGAAGRFHDAKDYFTLFKAVAPLLQKNSNLILKVAGRDVLTTNPTIRQYMTVLDIPKSQVVLLGQVANMEDFYENVDFFVLSSKTEGFPNVLAEAASHGCIIFSTDVGDASLIVNDQDRIVPIGASELLTHKLEKYINKPSIELLQLSQSTADRIRSEYSIDVISKKIFEIGKE